MQIKDVIWKGSAALAPMAGVADRAFREICCQFGAGYTVTEMVSAKGLCMCDRKSRELLKISDIERPCAPQLFGDDPEFMAKAAVKTLAFNPEIIDINMGCPAPKIAGNGGGSALMKQPELAEKIVEAVVKAVDIPVTVKMRIGWDDENINCVDLAKRCENAGAAALTVHGRTKVQMYSPPVRPEYISDVREAVSIPVIGNGDICSPADALRMINETNCDGIMVGRACMGDPWIFGKIRAAIEGKDFVPPTDEEFRATILEQIKLMIENKGKYIAVREARKHLSWYTKGRYGSAALRDKINKVESAEEIFEIVKKI